ncbi:hypothetical protein Bbelb_115840 [Branchiostoma belcheri]|nr:hypothetical protein Bbelb_115840 [Branchiostoma belcheri]
MPATKNQFFWCRTVKVEDMARMTALGLALLGCIFCVLSGYKFTNMYGDGTRIWIPHEVPPPKMLNRKFSAEHGEEICDIKRNLMFVKVHKAGGTTTTCIFQRFGYEHNLTFVLPMNRKSDVGWPHFLKQEDFIPSADDPKKFHIPFVTPRERRAPHTISRNFMAYDLGFPLGLFDDQSFVEEYVQKISREIDLPAAIERSLFASRWFTLLAGTVFGICITQLFVVPDLAAPYAPKSVGGRLGWLLRDSTQRSGGQDSTGNIQHHANIPAWKARLSKAELTSTNTKEPRKILLDCGANVASTVQLFRETYPDGRDFIIHSFEIDERLTPFFAPYPNHVLHCPTGVSNKDGNMTAYSELVWSPNKGLNNGIDMQWGGGSLFAYEDEKRDTETGGKRKLSHHRTVPTVDLSRWIQENTAVEDYVIFKLDVEGAEYDILKKMLEDGTFKWVDKYYGEYHSWQPVTGWVKEKKEQLVSDVQKKGKPMLDWAAEYRTYRDFDTLHPPLTSVASNVIGWRRLVSVSHAQPSPTNHVVAYEQGAT